MQVSCLVCTLTAEVMLGLEGYTIAPPPCFTLQCPQISARIMAGCDPDQCETCPFMERAAARVFANYMMRQ